MGELEKLVASLMVQAALADQAMEADLEGHIHINAIHCPYCGTNSASIEAATAHDGECQKHPMAVKYDAKCAEAARMREAAEKAANALRSFSTEATHPTAVTVEMIALGYLDAVLTPDDGWLARRDAEREAGYKGQLKALALENDRVEAERDGLAATLRIVRVWMCGSVKQAEKALGKTFQRLINATEDKTVQIWREVLDGGDTHLARIRREAKAEALREAADHMKSKPEAWGADRAEYFGRLIAAELRLLANREEAAQ